MGEERGILGVEVTLEVGDGVTPTEGFTKIANVKNIGGPSMSREQINQTAHGDQAQRYRPGLPDGGEVPLEIMWDPAETTHDETTGLLKLFNDGTIANFKMKFGSAATWTFAAFVSSFEGGGEAEGGLFTASVTLKLDGLPTFA